VFSLTRSSSRSHSDIHTLYCIFVERKGFSLQVDSYDNLFMTNQPADCRQEERNADVYSAGIIFQKTVICKSNAVWFQCSYCCIMNKKEKILFTIYTELKGKHAADNLGQKILLFHFLLNILLCIHITEDICGKHVPHSHFIKDIWQ